MNGTKAFLPHLIASGDGHVINVSSAFGLYAVPYQAAYSSAKFAVRAFTQALHMEMLLAGHPVKVSTVYPGGTKTAFVRNMTAAERLGDVDLVKTSTNGVVHLTAESRTSHPQGVRKNRLRILIGPDTKLFDLLSRITGPLSASRPEGAEPGSMPPTS